MSEIRDNYFKMMKSGKFRAFRNLPVGWVLQIIHSTDKTERYFRLFLEGFIFLLVLLIIYLVQYKLSPTTIIVTFIVIHTISWFLVGNFWVYMLDSFKFVKNTGLNDTLKFIQYVKKVHGRSDGTNAILIYGSFCRDMFHIRSDLDLRIVRRTDSKLGFLPLYYAVLIRAYSFFKGIPVDYQVVDSMAFLRTQMRDDEKPVVVYKRSGFIVDNEGCHFKSILENPSTILRDGQPA